MASSGFHPARTIREYNVAYLTLHRGSRAQSLTVLVSPNAVTNRYRCLEEVVMPKSSARTLMGFINLEGIQPRVPIERDDEGCKGLGAPRAAARVRTGGPGFGPPVAH
jgi:hypothetical protein